MQFLRELLDNGVLAAIAWLDTRDMCSDGLTKGTVAREALMLIMDGIYTMGQVAKVWRPKLVNQV